MNRVLRDVDEIASAEVPPGRLLRDPRVVLLGDLGLDVPVEAMALAGHHVYGLIGHVPVLRAFAARRDLLLVDVHAVRAHVRLVGRRDDADAPVARVLPPRVALLDDLLLLARARGPELRPILAWAEARRLEGTAAALLPEAHRHPVRLRLHHQSEGAHVFIGVVVLVDAVRVHDREIVLLPVVSDAVVDLVALALEDVEARLVLVAVAVIGAAREELDEMHLQRLRQEGIVARPKHPRGPRLVGVARVADARVVDDGAGTADAVRGALAAAELPKPVGLGTEPAKEDPALALG